MPGLLPVAEAQRRILEAVPQVAAEQIPVARGLGRVLAADLRARRSQPPTAVSAMDGYAVRAEDVAALPAELAVVGYAPAGHAHDGRLQPGEAVRIFTGAPLPDGADAVVIQENAERDGNRVRVVTGEAAKGAYVRPAGLDFREGDVLLEAGRVLTARDVGLAAAMNIPWLMVRRRPRISILATGDEIVMPGDPVGRDQIVSSNALALCAFAAAQGADATDIGIAPDDAGELRAIAENARGSDLLVTTGGASVGDHDLVREVLGNAGLAVDFWRIAMRPGKPLMFGAFRNSHLIGLPGNPVSSLVCAIVFLAPAIRRMTGMRDVLPRRRGARLDGDLGTNDEREDYLRATLSRTGDGMPAVTPFSRQDSSMFATMARADALIVRPPFVPPARAGDAVEIIDLEGGVLSI